MNEKTAEKTSLEIIRFISAPPARVYDAWTDPARLKQWFGPENVRTRNITAEVRVGGKYRLKRDHSGGRRMGRFRRIPRVGSRKENCLHMAVG
jgi:uncharacterized protein YndB with AHSA1/START domain